MNTEGFYYYFPTGNCIDSPSYLWFVCCSFSGCYWTGSEYDPICVIAPMGCTCPDETSYYYEDEYKWVTYGTCDYHIAESIWCNRNDTDLADGAILPPDEPVPAWRPCTVGCEGGVVHDGGYIQKWF